MTIFFIPNPAEYLNLTINLFKKYSVTVLLYSYFPTNQISSV